MAVKIRLKRMGKIRQPHYRVVVVDARKKRDGKVIEEIGKYHPKEEPSFIEVTSDRAQYWLGVGAQPSEAVEAILKITGDWQKFKGLPGTEGTLRVAEPKRDKTEIFNEALKDAGQRAEGRGDDRARRPPRPLPPTRSPVAPPVAETPAAGETPAEAPAEAEGRPARCRGRRREVRGLTGVLADALEHLVRGIVDNPDDVSVRDKQLRRGSILEVRVHPDDLGKVIGRGGRTATAFRTVIRRSPGAAARHRLRRRRPSSLTAR